MNENIPQDTWPNKNGLALGQFLLVSMDAGGSLVLSGVNGTFVGSIAFPCSADQPNATVFRLRPHDRCALIAAATIRPNRLLEMTAGGRVQEAQSPAGGVTSFASLNSANAGDIVQALYLDGADGLTLSGQIFRAGVIVAKHLHKGQAKMAKATKSNEFDLGVETPAGGTHSNPPGGSNPPRVLVRIGADMLNIAAATRIAFDGDPPVKITLFFGSTNHWAATTDVEEMRMIVAVCREMLIYVPDGCQ